MNQSDRKPKRERSRVSVPLGHGADTPNFRNAMTEDAGLLATFPDSRTAIVEPGDPPCLFDAHRLASRGTSRDRMWQILEQHPRRDQPSQHSERAVEEINRVAGTGEPQDILYALGLLLLITSNADLRRTLEPQLDGLWASFPDASLWLITAEDALLSRLTLSQLLFQFEQTPDLDISVLMSDPRRSLEAQSLMGRVASSDVVQPIFSAFSPAVTGFAAPWLPHTLALEFGAVVSLRRPWPPSLGALYEPRVLSPAVNADGREAWINSIPKTSLGTLLAWWVSRLDRLFGIITDPTRFAAAGGRFDAAAQLAFRLTVERVLADLRLLNASPQASALARLGTAFDLLDKLETLLGYGPRSGRELGREWGSGRGFRRLLDRTEAVPLMGRGFAHLPAQLSSHFDRRAQELFDETYREIQDGVLKGRRLEGGVRVGRDEQKTVKLDEYVGLVVRAVRNSSHGLLDQLAGRDAEVAVTHTGALPESLPELVALLAWSLLADPERLWSMQVWS